MTDVEWTVAMTVRAGENESGDRHVACRVSGRILFAVVDGLGHGSEAAIASKAAIQVVERYAHEPLDALAWRCHDALRATRGAVMSLASFDDRERLLSWLGIGNVAGLLVRADPMMSSQSLLLRGGVVGARLPTVQAASVEVASGDVLVLATDGIGTDFADSVGVSGPLQAVAERVLSRHARGVDDALVLLARFGLAA